MNDHTDVAADSPVLLEGLIAVEAVLFSEAREVLSVLADGEMDYRKLEPIRRLAKKRGIEIEKRSREQLDERVGHGKHGGVVASVGPRTFVSMQDLLTYSGDERAFIVMLDGVEDPFNFGQALRSLYACGCHGVVVRPRNWAAPGSGAEAVIARASAGASELMPLAIAETPDEAAAFYAEKGLAVAAAADDREAVALPEADLSGPLFLLIGGEKRGVKRSFLNQCNLVLRIPYARTFDHALGTVAATSILAHAVSLQRVRRG